MQYAIYVADASHYHHCETICQMMAEAAKLRGTGIAKRSPAYIQEIMAKGKGIIALDKSTVIGFCYIESWENKKFVANSGLIVHPGYRKMGLAKAIKKAAFQLSQKKYPSARLFGITTSAAVMKINTELGYQAVHFSNLPQDETFWKGCQTCKNHDILLRTQKTMCLCTAMVCTPNPNPKNPSPHEKA